MWLFRRKPICCFPMSILLWKSASMEFVSLVTLEDLFYIFPDAIQLLIRYNVHNNICQIDLNLILSTNLNSDYSTFEVQIKSQARCKNIYITTSCYYSYPTLREIINPITLKILQQACHLILPSVIATCGSHISLKTGKKSRASVVASDRRSKTYA